MKILIICRYMSGFSSSVKSGCWEPTGSPALYKLINYLDKSDNSLKLIFAEKEIDIKKSQYHRDIVLKLRGLKAPIYFLHGPIRVSKFIGRLKTYLSEFRQIAKIFRIIMSTRPEVIYVDRSNILAASFIARFTKIPVVLRLLGVTPAMQDLMSKPALSHYLYRWAYRSPFKFVLCTKDGSPNKVWMSKALRDSVQREVWLNGADHISQSVEKNTQIHIVILGRLDPLKRIQECIDAILGLPKSVIEKIKVSVIGTGILEQFLRKRVEFTDFKQCVSFLGAVPHADVRKILSEGDIYISLNAQGNLSNANLEAMKAGLCFILPQPDPITGIDMDTSEIIPENAAMRIAQDGLVVNLSKAILHLIHSPSEIEQRKCAMIKAAELLVNWDHRIKKEVQLLVAISEYKKRSKDVKKEVSH